MLARVGPVAIVVHLLVVVAECAALHEVGHNHLRALSLTVPPIDALAEDGAYAALGSSNIQTSSIIHFIVRVLVL